MNEQKFQKALRDTKWFSVFLLILILIIFVGTLFMGNNSFLIIVIRFLQLALTIGAVVGCNKELMYGPVCGVILSILMILSFSFFDIILGIAFLIDCINVIRYMKN